MKFPSCIHAVALAVIMLMQGVAAQEEEGGSPVGLIVLAIGALIGIGVGYFMMSSLKQKDNLLPEDQRYLTEGRQVLFWVLCLCGGLLCGLLFYCIASQDIETRLRRITAEQQGQNVPIAVVPVDKA